MKKILLIMLLLYCIQITYAQDTRSLNIIITINEKIVENVGSSNFILKETGSSLSDTINVLRYYSGCLLISQTGYDKLISSKADSVSLFFYYNEPLTKQNDWEVNYYEIEFNKAWFKDYYSLINIYNLDIKKYRKIFYPLNKQRNYTYEYYGPSGFVIIRPRRE